MQHETETTTKTTHFEYDDAGRVKDEVTTTTVVRETNLGRVRPVKGKPKK